MAAPETRNPKPPASGLWWRPWPVSALALTLLGAATVLGLAVLATPGVAAQGTTAEGTATEGTATEGTTADAVTTDALTALKEGNRLFRDGRIEEAVAAYRTGYHPQSVHPTLVYNLATALHHLGRLPEAILWYRRADASNDPWLEENLWLARRTLGSQTLAPAGLLGLLAKHRNALRAAATLLAWLALATLILIGRQRRWPSLTAFALAAVCFVLASAAAYWGGRPAVLLRDCATAAGDLPAGTEAWVRPGPQGDWRMVARSADAVCPHDAVALVFPSGS